MGELRERGDSSPPIRLSHYDSQGDLKMKFAILVFAFLLPFAAQAKPTLKSGRVSGVRVEELTRILARFDLGTAGMGKWDLEVDSITCTKTVDGDLPGDITCSVYIDLADKELEKPMLISTRDEKDGDDARILRALLIEISNADKKISKTQKRIVIKDVKCHGASSGHEFDDLELETSGGLCKFSY
jgi:hypothetical protein